MAMLHPKRWTQIFPPAPTFGEKDVGLKKGKVFVVTGGNQGVGFELCKMLRGTGATVYIASRSKVSLDAAIEFHEAVSSITEGLNTDLTNSNGSTQLLRL